MNFVNIKFCAVKQDELMNINSSITGGM